MAQSEDPAVAGKWADEMIELKNVAACASLKLNGKVLYWVRRSNPKSFFPLCLSTPWNYGF
jgi:hypothetical protein